MKLLNNKLVLATAVSAGLGLASTNALAFPEFTIDETTLSGGAFDEIIADKIIGNYNEVARFGGDGPGTFELSLIWTASSYENTNGVGALASDLNDDYQLYALFDAEGDFTLNDGGTPADPTDDTFDFVLDPGSTVTLWLDGGFDTTFNANTDSILTSSDYINVLGTADTLLGTGTLFSGGGQLDADCDNNIDCGSFGTDSAFALSTDGEDFFVLPVPFYDLVFNSGQFNNFDPESDEAQLINGSLDLVFDKVPEPSSLALLAAGLIGFGLSRKKANA